MTKKAKASNSVEFMVVVHDHVHSSPAVYMRQGTRLWCVKRFKTVDDAEHVLFNMMWVLNKKEHFKDFECRVGSGEKETFPLFDYPRMLAEAKSKGEEIDFRSCQFFASTSHDFLTAAGLARVAVERPSTRTPCPIKKTSRPTSKKAVLNDWTY